MTCEAPFFTCCPFLLSDMGVELPLRERQDLEPGMLSMILCQISPILSVGGKEKLNLFEILFHNLCCALQQE